MMSKQKHSLALAIFSLGQSYAIDAIGRMDQRVQNGEDPESVQWDTKSALAFIESIANGDYTPIPGELSVPQAERREVQNSFVVAAQHLAKELREELAAG